MTKKVKSILEQAFLDHLAFPFLKRLYSTLSAEDRENALGESAKSFKKIAQQHPEGIAYFIQEFQKIIPDNEPLETFEIINQLPSGERKN